MGCEMIPAAPPSNTVKRKLSEGELVEVRQKDVGLRGSWHPAVVIRARPGWRVVEYEELYKDDFSQRLVESIPVGRFADGTPRLSRRMQTVPDAGRLSSEQERRPFLRPRAPSDGFPAKLLWKKGCPVEMACNDAWWEGVLQQDVAEVGLDGKVLVDFPDEGGGPEPVDVSNLRFGLEWDERTGLWAPRRVVSSGERQRKGLAKKRKVEDEEQDMKKKVHGLVIQEQSNVEPSVLQKRSHAKMLETERVLADSSGVNGCSSLKVAEEAVSGPGKEQVKNGHQIAVDRISDTPADLKEAANAVAAEGVEGSARKVLRKSPRNLSHNEEKAVNGMLLSSQNMNGVAHETSHSESQNKAHEIKPEAVHASEQTIGRSRRVRAQPDRTLRVRAAPGSEEKQAAALKSPREKKKSSRTSKVPLSVFGRLFESSVLVENEPLEYRNRKDGSVMKTGHATKQGVVCDCCNELFPLAKFELHAGCSARRASANVFRQNGQSLAQCLASLAATGKAAKRAMDTEEEKKLADGVAGGEVGAQVPVAQQSERRAEDFSDELCRLCGEGGDLLCCDACPATFHMECVDVKELPEGDWFCPACRCTVCQGAHFLPEGFGDNTVLFCDHCGREYHVGCLRSSGMANLKRLPKGHWFCRPECEKVHSHLQRLIGRKLRLPCGLSWSLLHFAEPDLSAPQTAAAAAAAAAAAEAVEQQAKQALDVLHECFHPIRDEFTQEDLLDIIVHNRRTDHRDYSGFYTIVLENDKEMITAATVRVYGNELAEVPLIGTRFKFRRQGMCRTLINAMEQLFGSLGVGKLVLPAVPEALPTWRDAFGFQVMSRQDMRHAVELDILVFPGTQILQRLIKAPPAPPSSGPKSATKVKLKLLKGHKPKQKVNSTINLEAAVETLPVVRPWSPLGKILRQQHKQRCQAGGKRSSRSVASDLTTVRLSVGGQPWRAVDLASLGEDWVNEMKASGLLSMTKVDDSLHDGGHRGREREKCLQGEALVRETCQMTEPIENGRGEEGAREAQRGEAEVEVMKEGEQEGKGEEEGERAGQGQYVLSLPCSQQPCDSSAPDPKRDADESCRNLREAGEPAGRTAVANGEGSEVAVRGSEELGRLQALEDEGNASTAPERSTHGGGEVGDVEEADGKPGGRHSAAQFQATAVRGVGASSGCDQAALEQFIEMFGVNRVWKEVQVEVEGAAGEEGEGERDLSGQQEVGAADVASKQAGGETQRAEVKPECQNRRSKDLLPAPTALAANEGLLTRPWLPGSFTWVARGEVVPVIELGKKRKGRLKAATDLPSPRTSARKKQKLEVEGAKHNVEVGDKLLDLVLPSHPVIGDDGVVTSGGDTAEGRVVERREAETLKEVSSDKEQHQEQSWRASITSLIKGSNVKVRIKLGAPLPSQQCGLLSGSQDVLSCPFSPVSSLNGATSICAAPSHSPRSLLPGPCSPTQEELGATDKAFCPGDKAEVVVDPVVELQNGQVDRNQGDDAGTCARSSHVMGACWKYLVNTCKAKGTDKVAKDNGGSEESTVVEEWPLRGLATRCDSGKETDKITTSIDQRQPIPIQLEGCKEPGIAQEPLAKMSMWSPSKEKVDIELSCEEPKHEVHLEKESLVVNGLLSHFSPNLDFVVYKRRKPPTKGDLVVSMDLLKIPKEEKRVTRSAVANAVALV